jgi:hypothetical protein
MQTGTLLPNGATVIAATDRVVLARWINDITPFVTWEYFEGRADSTVRGHYFDSLEAALKDFKTR